MQFTLTDANPVSAPIPVTGGYQGLYLSGTTTWNGATVTATFSPDNVHPYVGIGSGVSFTTDYTDMFFFRAGYVKFTLTNASSTSIFVDMLLLKETSVPIAPK